MKFILLLASRIWGALAFIIAIVALFVPTISWQLFSLALGGLALGIAFDSQHRAKKTDEDIKQILQLVQGSSTKSRSTISEALITVQAIVDYLALLKKGESQ